jgi:hypothetical protein
MMMNVAAGEKLSLSIKIFFILYAMVVPQRFSGLACRYTKSEVRLARTTPPNLKYTTSHD